MVTYGSLRCANFTDSRREDIWRAVIGLNKGELFPDDKDVKNVTAVNPLNDGVNRRVTWFPQGPLWDDGSCRNIVVTFVAALNAGVAKASRGDALTYDYFGGDFTNPNIARDIAITDDTPTVTNFSIHPNVLSRLNAFRMSLDVTVVDVTQFFQYNDPVHITNTIGIGHDANNEGRTQPVELDGPNASVTSAVVSGRVLSETVGGDATKHHSPWQEAVYSIGHNQPWIDVYWWWGQYHITKDYVSYNSPHDDPRCMYGDGALAKDQDITLTIRGPKLTCFWGDRVVRRVERTWDAATSEWVNVIVLAAVRNGGGWPTSIGNQVPSNWDPTQHDPKFYIRSQINAAGAYPCIRFKLFFDEAYGGTPLTANEQSTLDAFEGVGGVFNDGPDTCIYQIATNWFEKQRSYGSFGALPDYPGSSNVPGNFASLNEAYIAALQMSDQTFRDVSYNNTGPAEKYFNPRIRDRAFWHDPIFAFPPYGGASAGYVGFGTKLWPWARTAAPDLRIWEDAFRMEPMRTYQYKYRDGSCLDYRQHRNISGTAPANHSPRRMSDIFFVNFRLFLPARDYATSFGPWPGSNRGDCLGTFQSGRPAPGGGSFSISYVEYRARNPGAVWGDAYEYACTKGEWSTYDNEHTCLPPLEYFYQITGDIWFKFCELPLIESVLATTKPYLDGYFSVTEHGSSVGRTTTWSISEPRSEGRACGAVAQGYFMSGNEDLVQSLLWRNDTLWEQPDAIETGRYTITPDFRLLLPNATDARPNILTQNRVFGFLDSASIDTKVVNFNSPGSGVPNPFRQAIGFKPWECGLFPWNMQRLYFALSDLYVRNTLDPSGSYRTTIGDHILRQALPYAQNCYKHPWTNNKYNVFEVIDSLWHPTIGKNADFSNPGFTEQPSGPLNSVINPRTNRQYCAWDTRTWGYIWTVASVVAAYEIAKERNLPVFEDALARVINYSEGGLWVYDYNRWGWENCTNSDRLAIEYYAVVPDVYKDRTSLLRLVERMTWECGSDMSLGLIGAPLTLEDITMSGATSLSLIPTVPGTPVLYILEEDILIVGSTNLNFTLPLDPTVIQQLLPSFAINGVTVITLVPDPRVNQGNFDLVIDMTGSTNFTRFNAIVAPANIYREIYNIEATFEYDRNLYLTEMPAKHQSIEIFAGNSVAVVATLIAIEGSALESNAWIESEVLEYRIKRRVDATEVVVSKTFGNGQITFVGDKITILLEPEDTNDLEGVYYHEAIARVGGAKVTLFTGNVTVQPSAFAANEEAF